MNKISRRNLLKMLGASAASIVVRPMPLPVDMSKGQSVEEPEPQKEREWAHPCTDKTVPDVECKHCHFYFCPLEAEAVYRWRRNEWCKALHGEEDEP